MKKTADEKSSFAKDGRHGKKKMIEPSEEALRQGLDFLRAELDLSFTFTTLAITAYASGSLEHARQAARDAQKGFQEAQRQLVRFKLSSKIRQAITARLNTLQQALATLETKDPGVFDNHDHSSAETGK